MLRIKINESKQLNEVQQQNLGEIFLRFFPQEYKIGLRFLLDRITNAYFSKKEIYAALIKHEKELIHVFKEVISTHETYKSGGWLDFDMRASRKFGKYKSFASFVQELIPQPDGDDPWGENANRMKIPSGLELIATNLHKVKSAIEGHHNEDRFHKLLTLLNLYYPRGLVDSEFAEFLFGNKEMDSLIEPLEQGTFRVVYEFKGNDDYVLKIVKDEFSKHMNIAEADVGMMTEYPDLFPKVYDSASDGSWILSEKVVPLNDEEQSKDFFPELDNIEYKTWQEIDDIIDIDIKKFLNTNAIYPGCNISRALYAALAYYTKILSKDLSDFLLRDKNLYKFMSRKWVRRLIEASLKYKVELWDIKVFNLGVNKKNQLVIIDASIGLT